ncbi:ArsR/SmtB family transcription factor [Thermoanaerobacter wiegelii]|uniref:Transcriptional regulator, ArsR family n=1 Tax=Thermoanaerobacter wiegelii Rt8.B1 TaxID=697303 RepID=G2MUS7_9THEO|nr:metalloregulator ArsR/SmtB family transcription factor [Thermoanaerobacter wiegelii]AEM77828.1 transcriptional regulator, ArsR family [Thermoanaerobacter wiegelii Rt8.B1]
MEADVYTEAAEYFKALSHPTRIKIIELLSKKEMCVCQMMAALNLDQSHVSRHLMVLRANKMVKTRREGTIIYYSLTDKNITNIIDEVKNVFSVKK